MATIHNLEERNPSTSIEYAVELFGYLLGVFILAVLIGEVGTAALHTLPYLWQWCYVILPVDITVTTSAA